MALQTALESLLQQAGYSSRRASRLAEWIDHAAIPGMSADDLYAAFIQWRRKTSLSEAKLKGLGRIDAATNEAVFEIQKNAEKILADRLRYQPVFRFAEPLNATEDGRTDGETSSV